MYLFSRQSINSNSGPRVQATIVDAKKLTDFFHQLFLQVSMKRLEMSVTTAPEQCIIINLYQSVKDPFTYKDKNESKCKNPMQFSYNESVTLSSTTRFIQNDF